MFGHVYHLQKNNVQLITRFTNAALEIRLIEAIKFFGILKKSFSKNKIYFCLKKKSNVLLNKKVIFVFYNTNFEIDFIRQIIYCIIHRYLYSLFIPFLFSYINKMNEKRSQEYQSTNPEYVTGQINSRILELHRRRYCRLILAPSRKS